MVSETVNVKVKDLVQIKRDLAIIKKALLSECELTTWAKNQLDKAKSTSRNEYVDHEKVKEMIIAK